MEKEIIDEVVEALIPNPKTNNLAARISILYKMISENPDSIGRFTEKQIFSIRKDAKKFKKEIKLDIYKKIENIADYFEAILTAFNLSK